MSAMEPITPDGGVRKRVTRPGKLDDSTDSSGEPSAPVGARAKVTIRYSLSLPGVPEPFDSSSTRPSGLLSFTLGKRKAIRGLEALAASMCVGEYCVGEIDAGWAYGVKGLERCGVPGNTAVECEMEMVDAVVEKKGKSILEMTARERFVEAGECKERGNDFFRESKVEKAAAEYQRCLRYIEYVFYRPRREESETSDVTGSEDERADDVEESGEHPGTVLEGQDGQTGSESLGDGSKLEADADEVGGDVEEEEVVEVDVTGDGNGEEIAEVDVTGYGNGEEVAEVDTTGDGVGEGEDEGEGEGDRGFVEAETAADGDASKGGGSDAEAEDPVESEVRELHIVTLNNFALCCIKMGENKKAVDSASLAATMDKSSHKPLFYRARARGALGDWEEAKADLLAAAKLAPKNMGIRIELDKLNKKMKAHKANERKAAAAMFG